MKKTDSEGWWVVIAFFVGAVLAQGAYMHNDFIIRFVIGGLITWTLISVLERFNR